MQSNTNCTCRDAHVPTHKILPFPLRLQPAVRTALERAAKRNNQSLQIEIEQRLAASLPHEGVCRGDISDQGVYP